MRVVVGAIFVTVGGLLVFTGPRLARSRISLHFSTEDLRATSGERYRRVRRALYITYAFNEAIAGFWIYLGIRLLTT